MFFRNVALSLLIHVVVIFAISFFQKPIRVGDYNDNLIKITLVQRTGSGGLSGKQALNKTHLKQSKKRSGKAIDLRPKFMRGASRSNEQASETKTEGSSGQVTTNGFARALLHTESKVFRTFDQLAVKINVHLDYPHILVENGVQGHSTLDLFFDNNANVDEARSRVFGNHRSLRGLLARAARKGIVEWYLSDAYRLEKEKFRKQHFRAEFYISHSLSSNSQLKRSTGGDYTFVRRANAPTCLSPAGGGIALNIVCGLNRIGGAIRGIVSDKYKARLMALTDVLEHYDNLELDGINIEIKNSS